MVFTVVRSSEGKVENFVDKHGALTRVALTIYLHDRTDISRINEAVIQAWLSLQNYLSGSPGNSFWPQNQFWTIVCPANMSTIIVSTLARTLRISSSATSSWRTIVQPSRNLSSSQQLLAQLYFTKKHEWVNVEGDMGTVGISNYAQEALGDVVYAQLPEAEDEVSSGTECGTLESVKAASEIFSPVSGVVTAKNEKVEAAPALINTSPMEEGWLFKVKFNNPEELNTLLDEAAYEAFLKTQEDDH
eukprot:maker-scaffold30_size591359-snap-gene-0.9 protein:Tk12746 transcript:maker-scaffold30_size591359-snap-gene-0.9-mRNA-1 annotation:"glycine cleavage system h mitochondrial-like"